MNPARDLILGLSLHLYLYFVYYVSSEFSCMSAHTDILAQAFLACPCEKYQNHGAGPILIVIKLNDILSKEGSKGSFSDCQDMDIFFIELILNMLKGVKKICSPNKIVFMLIKL